MRIVHVTPYYAPAWAYGGPVRVAVALCEGLVARGHEVTVVTTDTLDATRRAPLGTCVLNGVRVVRIPNVDNGLAWRRVFLPVGLREALREALPGVEIAHLHEARSALNLIARRELALAGVPYVLSAHGSLPHHARRSPIKAIYDALGGRAVLRDACRLHAISQVEAEQFRAAGFGDEQIAVIPNGIYPDEYRDLPDGTRFRELIDAPPDAPLVLFLSRLHPIKGVEFLIRGFAALRNEMPEAILALVGPDDGAEAAARARIRALGLEGAVRFHGFLEVADKLSAYRAADVYVLPSRFDVFSIGLVEAMACGASVVVSSGCALAGEIDRQGAGLVVDYGDEAGLVAALRETLTDRQAAAMRGERARTLALNKYDWASVVERMEQLYSTCVEGAL
jgi:glycosyltransferase involved in cell wall biosynthesis